MGQAPTYSPAVLYHYVDEGIWFGVYEHWIWSQTTEDSKSALPVQSFVFFFFFLYIPISAPYRDQTHNLGLNSITL